MTNDPMNPPLNGSFTDDELRRRRASARRMGWWFASGVLALYLIGFFIKR